MTCRVFVCFLLLLTPVAADEKRPDKRYFYQQLGIEFVDIPAGEFVMGSNETEDELSKAKIQAPAGFTVSDERPAHKVKISGFRMQTTEVTRAQVAAYSKATGSLSRADEFRNNGGGEQKANELFKQMPLLPWPDSTRFLQTDEHPVVNISWREADLFCKWLTQESLKRGELLRFQLPTEAQWEYACRAGARTRFSTGDDPGSLKGSANVADIKFRAMYQSVDYKKYQVFTFSDGAPFTSVVGHYDKNKFGLYDMHGNVMEWCRDWYGESYYQMSPNSDPEGPPTGEFRVLRGGSWDYGPCRLRCAARSYGHEDGRCRHNGFRLVIEQ